MLRERSVIILIYEANIGDEGYVPHFESALVEEPRKKLLWGGTKKGLRLEKFNVYLCGSDCD